MFTLFYIYIWFDYANLYRGYLEDQYVLNNNPFINDLVLYKRYIDDCFIIYKGSASDFEAFALYMNCLRPSIKFTYHVGTIDMNFLDTNISVINGQLVSSLYRKETAKKQSFTCKECSSHVFETWSAV